MRHPRPDHHDIKSNGSKALIAGDFGSFQREAGRSLRMVFRQMLVFAALMSLGLTVQAQTGVSPTGPGIGLTQDHKRTIYREIGDQKPQRVPEGAAVEIGKEIPDSIILNEMPISVKDQIGVLRDFKSAKLPDEKIVIVDPAKRQVVDIVTKDEGTK